MLVVPIPEREFNLYALALPQGPNFEPYVVVSGWKCDNARSIGGVLLNHGTGDFGIVAFRRRIDHCFVTVANKIGFNSQDTALVELTAAMRPGDSEETIPPGSKKRRPLVPATAKNIKGNFKLLTSTITHYPALMAVGELYFAMPNPDDNFISDLQTDNFDSRLFELYLLAAFREQGITVSQDHDSPDFFIERAGHQCSIEAVTANPKEKRAQGLTSPTFAPESRQERTIGAPAVRFAKTLRSKLQREYEKLPHVQGKPFALALADFQAPSSMVWSREALPSYLYGFFADVAEGPDGRKVAGTSVTKLLGPDEIPAGLFRDPAMAHLSGIVFSNAATLGKFNRMGFLAGWQPPGLRMIRTGILFDRTPGAVEPIDFSLDILEEEYAALWPRGEQWCQELEVFHNPMAKHPIDFELLPGATHWFEDGGEIVCSTMWKNSVLSSVTDLRLKRPKPEKS
jgi:hypothetical protein